MWWAVVVSGWFVAEVVGLAKVYRVVGDRDPKVGIREAKKIVLRELLDFRTVREATAAAGRLPQTYEDWMRKDPEFHAAVSQLRAVQRRGAKARQDPGTFEHFRLRYLNSRTFTHQLQWIDLLEGRDPRDLHPSVLFEKGTPNRLLVCTPPNHAKSTTITMDYVTYRICQNPAVQVILVSKTSMQAKKFLYGIKQRLTSPRYTNLQLAFAPAEGYRSSADTWTTDKIYLERDSDQKDPTVEAIGLGGQIYGARADLIICDDVVTLSNAHEYEKQMSWIRQEVASRLGPAGRLLVVGTRVAPTDLYSELRNPEHYTTGVSPYTRLAQPAVLEMSERKEDWMPLWPRSDVPFGDEGDNERPDSEGLFSRWTPARLYEVRNEMGPKRWSLVYMQQEVSEESVFDQEKVRGARNKDRRPGPMVEKRRGHRAEGMTGLYVVAGLDPAMVGDSAIVVLGVDRLTRMRYVLDVRVKTSAGARWIREQIREVTDLYNVNEWRVERNAFQGFLTQDPEINEWLASQGVVLQEHHTGKNKWDIDFGVASMSLLFEQNLIELPTTVQAVGIQTLVEQLVTWAPETRNKADTVMALWFAEIRAREVIRTQINRSSSYQRNPFLSKSRKSEQTVVNLQEWARVAG